MKKQSKLLFFLIIFLFTFKAFTQEKVLPPGESLVDLKEFIFRNYLFWFKESPYKEVEKYLFSSEKLIEMGLFKDAQKDLDKAERLLQVVWSLERREKGLTRNLPPKEEFNKLTEKQKEAWESYLLEKLAVAFLGEELFSLTGLPEKKSYYEAEVKKTWEEYSTLFQEKESVYANLILLLDKKSNEKILGYLPQEKKNELSYRMLYRRLMRILLERGDDLSAYFVFQEYQKLVEKNLPPLAQARYAILFGQLSKALKILTESLAKESEEFADFYVQYEIKLLRLRLWLVLDKIETAKKEVQALKESLEKFRQKANLPREIFINLEEKRYLVLLEIHAKDRAFSLEPLNPAFSQETQIKFLWLNGVKNKDFLQNHRDMLPFWEFDESCFSQNLTKAVFLADWAFPLVFYTEPKCSWPRFEKKLVEKVDEIPPETFFAFLEERFQMEKNRQILRILKNQQSFLAIFFRYYLLKERDFLVEPITLKSGGFKGSLVFYESPYYFITFQNSGYTFWEKKTAKWDIENLSQIIKIPQKEEIWLGLYGESHQNLFESFFLKQGIWVYRELWEEQICEVCQKNLPKLGVGMRQEQAVLFIKKEIMDDIFAAFSDYTLFSPKERDFLEKIKQKALKYNLLLHFFGNWQIKENDLELYTSGRSIFGLADLVFLPNLEGLVFQDEQNVNLFSQLARLAQVSGANFLILFGENYEADFYVSFFYDFYYRLLRKKLLPSAAFKESYQRYLKTLGNKKNPPIVVFYGHF